MEELISKIEEQTIAFVENAKKQSTEGNKSAGMRARKASLELEKLLKEFRKASIEESKK